MMTTQIRDTQFGHVVRFLSREKLFRYNDEIDPSFYESPIHVNLEPGADIPDDDRDGQARDGGVASKEQDRQHGDPWDTHTSPNRKIEDEVIIVDWYGPDDPEVMYVYAYVHGRHSHATRIHRTGLATGSFW
jgi:DHA1 family multidrug resistance protein-like MFS transporter